VSEIPSTSDSAGALANLKPAPRKPTSRLDTGVPIDRLPPHSHEAEQGVLGCALEEPKRWMPLLCQCSGELFYDLRHTTLFNVLSSLWRDSISIDLISVHEKLKSINMLDQVGNISYLHELMNSVASPENLEYWLAIVREKYELRRIVTVCTDVANRAMTNGVPLEDLKFSIQSDLGEVFGAPTGGLPKIVSTNHFLSNRHIKPVELLEGLLHKGSKMSLSGYSKSYKTWMLINLAISVATGTPWMGRASILSRVLYVNFEIQDWSWQERITAILSHRALKPGDNLHLWNLRGHAADYRSLIPKIIQCTRAEKYDLIILDPLYKLYGGVDENAAGDVAALLNALESLSVQTGAAIAFGTHFSKGDASSKDAIDRQSGSGVFARDPDSLLIFTAHEEADAYTVEPILRNFKPTNPFCVRWHYPVFELATDLDPEKLKSTPGRKPQYDPIDLLDKISDCDESNPISISDWARLAQIPRKTLSNYMAEMRHKGWIKTVGEGSHANQCITLIGKDILIKSKS
jgi:AAA domain/DnaB-like helicase N terminal domain